jgi:hypothetical protein
VYKVIIRDLFMFWLTTQPGQAAPTPARLAGRPAGRGLRLRARAGLGAADRRRQTQYATSVRRHAAAWSAVAASFAKSLA